MKKALCLFIFLVILLGFNNANSQSISIFNCDASNFPTVRAKFFAFDAAGKQITNLSQSDFIVTENGIPRTVTNVSCPEPKQPEALSSVLVIDVSGSMRGGGLDIAKAVANTWIDLLPLGKSECAITSFSVENYLNQDFTTNKFKLINGINSLVPVYSTNYDAAMIDPVAGGILVAKTGKHKKVIVLLSDGFPNQEPQTAKIISDAKANNIAIYCVAIGMHAPQCMKDFANQTGGMYFEKINTKEEAKDCYKMILSKSQGVEPCQIEWQSGESCISYNTNLKIEFIQTKLSANTYYSSPDSTLARMEFLPPKMILVNTTPGIPKDTTILVTAINSDFNLTNVTSSNPAFTIYPTNFFLKAGQSRNLDISFIPDDSCYTFTKFTLENNVCPSKYYASGGFPGKLCKIPEIKIIYPNGGQEFIAGINTVINWDGVTADEKVKLGYTTNNGVDWELISNNATGLRYDWKVPNTPSNKCLVKVTTTGGIHSVNIGNQSWMEKNLDVDCYRNGDLIPEVTDSSVWVNLTSGAWCYYNNDPEVGAIYGKLYNWHAVNDSRGLTPRGWLIPSDTDWTELEDYLGGSKIAGGKLKTTGTIEKGDGLWYVPNYGATNETGFSSLPSGYRHYDGFFYNLGYYSDFWSSSETHAMEISSYNKDCSIGNVEKIEGLSVRCIRDTAAIYYQSDQSDAVFTIVAPQATSKDIDMKKCLVGSSKDSLITDFIINTGSYKFSVDSIYFSGADANAFSLSSGFPKYDLSPAESKETYINFSPSRAGIHKVTINIITQFDTLKHFIMGTGVKPKIEIISKLLDFGQVELGKEKTFQDTAIIKNISGSPLDITNVVQLGPDKKQFEIISGGGAFTLQPNETRKLTVRFKPIYIGRTSGQIGFEYNGVGTPSVVQLFGNGIGGLYVTIKNDSAYAGQVRRLKLVMSNAKLETIAAIAQNFEAKIRFQKTILTPIKKSERTVINDSIYMNIKGTFGSTLELAQMPVIAGLGNVGETTIDIVDFVLKDNSGNIVDFEIETSSGLFKLLGICSEGGTRLFNPSGKVEIMQINPNPASDDIEINVNLIEDGATTLSIFNSNGFKIKEFNMADETGFKTIKLDIRDYSNGLYFIQLQTPTVLENQKLMIIK